MIRGQVERVEDKTYTAATARRPSWGRERQRL